MCKTLNRPLLASKAFASPCGSMLVPLGYYDLKGFPERSRSRTSRLGEIMAAIRDRPGDSHRRPAPFDEYRKHVIATFEPRRQVLARAKLTVPEGEAGITHRDLEFPSREKRGLYQSPAYRILPLRLKCIPALRVIDGAPNDGSAT